MKDRCVLGVAAMAVMSLFGPLAFADNLAQGGPLALHMRAGTVDTDRGGLSLPQAIAGGNGQARFVVQLDGPITPERRGRLTAAGIRLGDYLPDHAYIATLGGADARAAAGLEFVRWVGEYQEAWKLDPEIGQRAYTTQERVALTARGLDQFTVALFDDADVGAAEKSIWAIRGAAIRDSVQIGSHMELLVEMPSANVGDLARIGGVQFVEPAPEVTPRSNMTTRWIVQSNMPGVTPLYANGIRGEGQIVGILDGRVDINHCSFRDQSGAPIGPLHRKVVGMFSSGSGNTHGTHVGGIVAGDAGNEDNTRGVAYMGKLSWASYNLSGTTFTDNTTWNRDRGARIHTNSWGNDGTTSYDGLCRAIDQFTWSFEDDVVCFAVTNQSQLKNPENAKNVVAVGNTQDTPSQHTICTGGRGPTSDGRRKPEIWAPGCATASSASGTSCGTTNLTGTSMASPAIAGVAMLVRQYYTDGYYPLGLPSGTGFVPSGALIRATMMNTGQDLTAAASGFQTPTGYPSFEEGWGRVKADDALYFPGDARKLLVHDVRNASGLSTGSQDTHNIVVLGSGQQVRITLAWTEPPGTAGAGNPVVNDLDLEVVDANGVTYLGNVFTTTTGQSAAGGTKDAKNIIEQVHVANPPVGQWTVRVKGGAVAQGTQGYALVVTGDIQPGTPPPLLISLPQGIPGLIAPATPTDINVQVIPGAQNVVPGSPTMFYRLGGGSFQSQQLVSLGGNSYRATLPAASCGDTPEMYFAAEGDLGAVALLPPNAPANVLSTSIGTIQTNTLLTVDFDQALPAGWTSSGLWHLTDACAPGGTPCAGTRWAYYGQDTNCTFNTGGLTIGTLTAPPIALPSVPPGGSITLSFCSALVTEGDPTYDRATVLINGSEAIQLGDSQDWETRTVDLTPWAGQTVTIGFKFDSVDSVLNNFRGWHLDNLRIEASSQVCQTSCYANCDGSTTTPVLNVNDFVCFQQRFAAGDPYANCDGSTTVPILNVNDFVCFQQQFAAGCN